MSAGDDIHVGGMCPVQGEGEVDGHRWYFKARGQRWTLYVSAQPGGDPLNADAWVVSEPWGDEEFAAGYMPWDVAEGLVRAGLAKWRAEHPRCAACAEAVHTGGVWSEHTCGLPSPVELVSGEVQP